MFNDYSFFKSTLPSYVACELLDPALELGFHAARWDTNSFPDFRSFVRYTFGFSSVLQPYICDPEREDLRGWFQPDTADIERADDLLARRATTNTEVREWMWTQYPLISIPWLTSGLHCKLLSITDGEWPEMLAHDTDGFFTVFVADLT
ncbi:hypothetical protein [Roseiconus lacunae]|uniref:Uncharacterized protein n=1 Tax=Roseiconus lacunae TaxID=2605694 RepID=A0ABT7PT55_9BACT|nr:hypothetical protein [Roseiconus lacunae]MDM4019459.1 hypothetical protein [Roseiconus lacunae]